MKRYSIPITVVCIAINVIVFLLQIIGLFPYQIFAMAPFSIIGGQVYRIVTSSFMHADINHILANLLSFFNVGSYCEQSTNRRAYLSCIIFSMLGSGIAVGLFSRTFTLGFSGVVFGVLGYFMILLYKNDNRLDEGEKALLARMLIPNIIVSLLPGVSWQAHFGGFIGGAIAGLLFI